MKTEKVIFAGFGGQGIMSMGQLLTYAGMLEEKEVSFLPSYGPEMRGGTANCSVILQDSPIGSPVISHDATTAIVMNYPSLQKFESEVMAGGNIIVNSSLVEQKVKREDIHAYYIPANDLAIQLGNAKVANMIMLGAYCKLNKIVKIDWILEALKKVFGGGKEKLIPINRQALFLGVNSL